MKQQITEKFENIDGYFCELEQKLKVEKSEKEKFQNKCQEYERLNLELERKLKVEQSEKLDFQIQNYIFYFYLQEYIKLTEEYGKSNLELQKQLNAEKIEKHNLKIKIQRFEQISKEKEEFQIKCQEHERLNSELEQKLKVEKSENDKCNQKNLDFLRDQNNKFKAEIEKVSNSNNMQKQALKMKITDLECQNEKSQKNQIIVQNENKKLIVEKEKLLERVQMVGKIFNEVSNPNIQTKILIDSVNTTLGLPEINKEISFDLEIKNEIKNEFKKEVG